MPIKGRLYFFDTFAIHTKLLLGIKLYYVFRKEYKVILDELDWMDDITREKAHAKVDKITPYIGYPLEILNNTLMDDFYQGIRYLKSN